MKNIIQKIQRFEEELKYTTIFLYILQTILFLGLFLQRKGSLLLFIIFAGIQVFISVLRQNKHIHIYIESILFVLYLLLYFLVLVKVDIVLKLMFIMLVTIVIISLVRDKEKIATIINITKQLTNINFQKQEQQQGDIVVAKDKKTNKPIYIPYKDRFLHMLILGPTGSGKTSQTIIPMLNQDMQYRDCGITVLEPKGDLAEKVYAMAQHYGRKCLYFNPILESCPTFNPLYGKEEDIIENMVTTFKMLNPDSPQFFQDMNEQLVRNALKVLKRLKGNKATLIDLNDLLMDVAGRGKAMVTQLEEINKNSNDKTIQKENAEIINYFNGDYYKKDSKTYEHTSGVRSQVAKIVSNKYLRRVLNPENGTSDVDFDKHLEEGGVIAISTAQGKLRDLGSFLGYFIILNFQSSVFKRPGNENTRRPHFLYIDEFQKYANEGFTDMLTQGRSYRVSSVLATQTLSLVKEEAGDGFLEVIKTNCRNVLLYPDVSFTDAKFYSDQFGEIVKQRISKGTSKQRFSLFSGNTNGNITDSKTVVEEEKPLYSPSDIMYRPFGEITIKFIQNNTVQIPVVGKISFIPRELNDKLDRMIEENNVLMAKGYNPNQYRDFNNHGELTFPLEKIIIEKDEFI